MNTENADNAITKTQSIPGIWSFFMALASYATVCLTLVAIYFFVPQLSPEAMQGPTSGYFSFLGGTLIAFICFVVPAVLGVILGIIAVFSRNKKRFWGSFGLALNSLNLVVFAGLLVYIYR